jgi:hypothetical protein
MMATITSHFAVPKPVLYTVKLQTVETTVQLSAVCDGSVNTQKSYEPNERNSFHRTADRLFDSFRFTSKLHRKLYRGINWLQHEAGQIIIST